MSLSQLHTPFFCSPKLLTHLDLKTAYKSEMTHKYNHLRGDGVCFFFEEFSSFEAVRKKKLKF